MYTIQLRRDTAARWARINPVLADGEPGVERGDDDVEKLKIGDGSTPWNDLDYTSGGGDGSGVGPRGPQGIPGPTGPEGPTGPIGPRGLKGDPGPQGLQGLIGPEGPQGVQGVAGPQGSDGNSFNYRGDWDPATIFAVDDVAFYQGSSWIARAQNTGSEPSGASNDWDEIAIAGSPGPPGVDGAQGPEGPQGDRGIPGPQGIQGAQGTAGPKGDTGDPGPQGIQGPGGATGPAGTDGLEGPQGLQGPEGPMGPEGPEGPQGTQGVPGEQGLTGADGAQGPQGVPGVAGADGQSFNYRGQWDNAAAYLEGDVVFDNGSSWIAVADNTGSEPSFVSIDWDEIAIAGAQGVPGVDGAQGPQGIQGPAGVDGAQGPQGIQGVKGDTGDVGPQGPQGVQGVQGPIGNPATLVNARRSADITFNVGGWQGPHSFPTEGIDTDNFWNGSRFQPTRAGWYRISTRTVFSGAGAGTLIETHICKNATGTGDASTHSVAGDMIAARSDGWAEPNTSELVFFNGTTDYVEIYSWTEGNGIQLRGTSSSLSTFQAEAVGAAGPTGPQGVQGIQGDPAPSGAIVNDVAGVTSTDVVGLDPTKTYDFYVDGILAQGGASRYVSLRPNGIAPVNPGHVCRTTLQRSWVDVGGNASTPATVRVDEQGMVLGAIPFTEDQIISAHARVQLATGKPRICRSKMASSSRLAAFVNESCTSDAATRWDNTTESYDHMVVHFGGGTFTGRVIAVPADAVGSILTQDDDAWVEVDIAAQATYTIPNFPADKKIVEIELSGRFAGAFPAWTVVQPQGGGATLNARIARKLFGINGVEATFEGIEDQASSRDAGLGLAFPEANPTDVSVSGVFDFRTGLGRAYGVNKNRDVANTSVLANELVSMLYAIAQPTSLLVKFNQGNAATFTGKLRYRFKN